jgi:hypothetical protein
MNTVLVKPDKTYPNKMSGQCPVCGERVYIHVKIMSETGEQYIVCYDGDNGPMHGPASKSSAHYKAVVQTPLTILAERLA